MTTDSRPHITGLDAPGRFASQVVIAAAKVPEDQSLYPRQHVAVTARDDCNGRQIFASHEISFGPAGWSGGQGHYDLTYAQALADMIIRAGVSPKVFIARWEVETGIAYDPEMES